MPVEQSEQAAGNGGGDAVSAEYLNIPLKSLRDAPEENPSRSYLPP